MLGIKHPKAGAVPKLLNTATLMGHFLLLCTVQCTCGGSEHTNVLTLFTHVFIQAITKKCQRERRVPLKHESNLPVFMCSSWKDLNCCHICSANRTRWDKELFSKKAYSSSIWLKMCNRSPRQSLVNKVARTLAAFNHQFKIS